MATSGDKQLGVTDPLSWQLPTEEENEATKALLVELKKQGNYESAAATAKRRQVLEALEKVMLEFIKQALKGKGLSEIVANTAGGKLITYGSYRLGVYGPGSDIDTLVVAPQMVSRDDFFERFPDLLLKMSPEGAITGLTAVVDAFVPIIKFEYSDISIDLIFSRLDALTQIPANLNLQDSNLLRGLQDTDLRALNGTRVTDAILDLVPQQGVFRTALRAIKLWAQRRAIYANIIGFPGGVAWAMLVARICQLYPKASSSTIVLKFFRIMEKWQWPMPVMLKSIENGPLKVKVWNPRIYKGDSFHLMPIITPAYPAMCATHNVTVSTREIITRELHRGGQITDDIMLGKAQWKDLFAKHTFFTQGYKYYLSVISASTTKEAQQLWYGLVESKVRFLVMRLEGHNSIALAHPFNKGFDRMHECKTDEEIERAKGGSLQYLITEVPDTITEPEALVKSEVKNEVKDEDTEDTKELENIPKISKTTIVYTTTHYIGLELREGAKSLDLSNQVEDFKLQCMTWEKYNDNLNALNIIHTRNFDLPDDVFAQGEIRPPRPQKKKANRQNKKRSPSDESSIPAPATKRQQTSVAAAG